MTRNVHGLCFISVFSALFTAKFCEKIDLSHLSYDEIKKSFNPDNDPLIKFEIMNEIPGGTFLKGTDAPDANHGENPSKTLSVRTFHMDRYPVSVAHFKAFLRRKRRYKVQTDNTGFSYVISGHQSKYVDNVTVESHPSLECYKKIPGASWKYPQGKGIDLDELLFHPVTHVSFHDAQAYCNWKQKRLPTEIEWEFASRGGIQEKKYPWGGKFKANRSNLWQGEFPLGNTAEDGYVLTSPVNAYPPQNFYGLYDMLGNVWEWTTSVYKDSRNIGRKDVPKRMVIKGASFVDSERLGGPNHLARVTARRGEEPSFTAHNIGFRCALSDEQARALKIKVLPEHLEL